MKITSNSPLFSRPARPASLPGSPAPGSAQPQDEVRLSAPSPAPTAPVDTRQLSQQAQQSATGLALAGTPLGPALYQGLKTGFVSGYMSPSEIHQRCQKLAEKYPDLVDIVKRDYRTPGYDGKQEALQGPSELYYLRLGPKTEDRDQKLGVYQFAAPHAREWVNPMIMVELAEQLLANYDPASQDPAVRANTELLQNLDIYIAPMTNPDGTNFSMNDEAMWRKNRVPTEGGNRGVDINRNFPTGWTPGDPASQVYSGTAPMSEAETRHIVGVVDDHPNIRFVCDWHSYSEEFRRPEGVSSHDLPLYKQMHSRMNQALESYRGRSYGQVISEVVDGTSDDYFYHERKTYSTIVETARAFQPKPDEALQVMHEGTRAARELLRFAADYQQQFGLRPAQPGVGVPEELPAKQPAA